MIKKTNDKFSSFQNFFKHIRALAQETHVLFWLIATGGFFIPFMIVDVLSRLQLVSEPYDLFALFFMFFFWGLTGVLLIFRKEVSLFVTHIDGPIVIIIGLLLLLANWSIAIIILIQIAKLIHKQ